MEYRATITTPCEEHKSHTVTITSDGVEAWGAAESAIMTLEANGAKPIVNFYKDGNSVDWRRALDSVHLGFSLSDLLESLGGRIDTEELPF